MITKVGLTGYAQVIEAFALDQKDMDELLTQQSS